MEKGTTVKKGTKRAWQYHCPLGGIVIAEDGNAITNLHLAQAVSLVDVVEEETPLLHRAFCQLEEYFAGIRRSFDLPLAPAGTVFQQRVWTALQDIPYGTTCCYEQVAQNMGDSKWSRAVGRANHYNPILIVIPCHRVISKQGKLAGYAAGIANKEGLLRLEQAIHSSL